MPRRAIESLAPPSSDQQHSATRTVVIAVLSIFVTYLPINGVAGALSTIAADTGASTGVLQWVSVAYVIPMAAAVLSGGRLGDLYGRRRLLLIGLVAATIGAVVAGTADLLGSTAIGVLITGQAIAGTGGGLILPTTLALIASAQPDPRQRGRAIAAWATGTVGGLAAGPLVAGIVLTVGSWGWIFVPALVLGASASMLAALLLPESTDPAVRGLDWAGQLTAALGLAAIIFGVIQGGSVGWAAPPAVAGLSIGSALLTAFVVIESRVTAPLVELRLFRSLGFSAAVAAAAAVLMVIVGVMFLLSLHLGRTQSLSALEIGVRIVFVPGVAALVNPLVGRLLSSPKVSPFVVLAGGLLVGAIGMLLVAGTTSSTGYLDLIWRLAVFGVAVAMTLSSVTVAAISSAPGPLAGMAGSASTALRQFGGALGPAVFGSVYVSASSPAGGFTTAALTASAVLGAIFVLCVAAVLRGRRTRWEQRSPTR